MSRNAHNMSHLFMLLVVEHCSFVNIPGYKIFPIPANTQKMGQSLTKYTSDNNTQEPVQSNHYEADTALPDRLKDPEFIKITLWESS